MSELGFQDTAWISGNDIKFLDAILLQDRLVLPKVLIKAYYKPILRGFYCIRFLTMALNEKNNIRYGFP